MQLENIATPQEDTTPELRYASLHRAVERGLASEEVLRELTEICLQLGHLDEAVRIHANMKPGPTRDHVSSRLARRGLIQRTPGSGGPAFDDSDFGDDGDPSIAEHALDSIQYLSQSHMPAVALLTMLAFPIVVGLGGFLTSGGSLWLFAALAALPGLCVLGVVGAMGRLIFLQSADGEEEVPAIPAPAEMVESAKRYLGDVLIVLGALVAPSLTLLWFEAPLVSSLPGLVLGMFLVPIALVLRQIRGDIGALSPVALIRGIGCCRGYTKVTAAFWLAFAPAAIAFWSSLGHAVWLQIAIVGPLAVLPTFATARLLGTFTEVHRARLGLLLYPQGRVNQAQSASKPAKGLGQAPQKSGKFGTSRKPLAAPAAARALAGSPFGGSRPPAPAPKVQPRMAAPTAKALVSKALVSKTSAPKTAAPKAPAPKFAAPKAKVAKANKSTTPPPKLPIKPPELARKAVDATPQPVTPPARQLDPEDWTGEQRRQAPAAHIEGRAPKAPPARRPAPKPDAMQLAKMTVKRVAPAAPQAEDSNMAGPDLSNIPGATVITGDDRERLGAASRKR